MVLAKALRGRLPEQDEVGLRKLGALRAGAVWGRRMLGAADGVASRGVAG